MNSMNDRRNLCYLHNHIHQHWKFAWLAVMFDLPGQSSKHSCSSLWSGCWFILAWSSRKEQFFPPNFSGIQVLDLNFFGTASPLVLQLHELQFDQLLQLALLGPGINKKYGVFLACQNILYHILGHSFDRCREDAKKRIFYDPTVKLTRRVDSFPPRQKKLGGK